MERAPGVAVGGVALIDAHWFAAGPASTPSEKSAELPVTFAVNEHLLTSRENVTV